MALRRLGPLTAVSTRSKVTRAHKCVRAVSNLLTIMNFIFNICAPRLSPRPKCRIEAGYLLQETQTTVQILPECRQAICCVDNFLGTLFSFAHGPRAGPWVSTGLLWVFAEEGLRVRRVSWVRGLCVSVVSSCPQEWSLECGTREQCGPGRIEYVATAYLRPPSRRIVGQNGALVPTLVEANGQHYFITFTKAGVEAKVEAREKGQDGALGRTNGGPRCRPTPSLQKSRRR